MRTDKQAKHVADGPPPEAETVAPETEAPPKPQIAPEPESRSKSWGGPFTRMMEMEEPGRTEALEEAVQSGMTTHLMSRTDLTVRRCYGGRVLEISPQSKEFMAPHAIHILWYMSDQVGELED